MWRPSKNSRRSGSKVAGLAPRRAGSQSRTSLIEAGELFFPFRMVPAEQREVVHQRLWQITSLAVVGDARGAVALAELLAVGSEDHAEVDKLGLLDAQSLVEQALAGRVREVFFAPDHVRYLHVRVVDDNGEVVRRGAVGLQDHEVLDTAKRYLPPQPVHEATATPRRTEVQRAPSRLIRALVRQAGISQTLNGPLVDLPALALAVGAFVERQPEPREVFELCLFELGRLRSLSVSSMRRIKPPP